MTSPYYQSHLQNPNPNPNDPLFNNNYNPNPNDPLFNSNYNPNPLPTGISPASAPPVSSNYSTSDYSSYYFPSYPQNNTDHLYSDPNPQQSDASDPLYSFPHQPTSYYPYDQNQAAVNYDPTSLTSYSQSSYNGSNPPNFENPNQGGTNYGGYSHEFNGDGVYRYNRGKVEPYGAQGSRSESSKGLAFDDYGRPINVTNGNELKGTGTYNSKIVKAAPKIDTQQDVSSGVQKFRVKILSEGGGQTDMDVLCQIGLDGIRILDPATSRILKIYQLETVTRWEVLDSYIFAFWVKSNIDNEPRRIRLKSNSYSTNNILDTVAAASIQLKEMAESNKPSDPPKEYESEKKKGFADWMNLVKPGNEEKDHWVPDEAVTKCNGCRTYFGAFVRRHHCRNCGDIFCDKCTQGRIGLTADESAQLVRVCDRCMAEVTQRLSNAKEVTAKVTGLQSHEDLAKKLQEVMDKNRKTSTGMMPIGSDTRMREVECPTCTVHLQVKVPASGSETIECSVCRHPFLVSGQ